MGEQQLTEAKKKLRRQLFAMRDALPDDIRRAADRTVTEKLLAMAKACHQRQPQSPVFCFVSWRSEIDTHALIRQLLAEQIPVAVPRVEGREMQFYLLKSWEELESGYRGIPEPSAACTPVTVRQGLMLLPGAGFDKQGHRIGYGGGYYDRFLAAPHDFELVGMAYACQIVPQVPADIHDIRVSAVLTEGATIWMN